MFMCVWVPASGKCMLVYLKLSVRARVCMCVRVCVKILYIACYMQIYTLTHVFVRVYTNVCVSVVPVYLCVLCVC